jgi:hypothetical protein
MLPEDPARSARGAQTTSPTSAKIIPLRRAAEESGDTGSRRAAPRTQTSATRPTPRTREDAARHYLKFMLPGIPVTAFVMSFLYGYLLVGMHTLVLNGHAAESSYTPTVDPTLPLIGALLLAFATGMLCIAIYWGFLRISERGPSGN